MSSRTVRTRFLAGALLFGLHTSSVLALTPAPHPVAKRLIILKIDGLNADLLHRLMDERDPATGRSRLPWFSHIFRENGVVFENFYVRGISLSAPSWSMLDTGQHTIIRANVEYDRYTGRIYDYLNFFPLYLNYVRKAQVDMPGVEVLDRAGIPLVIDRFPFERERQSVQMFQRGLRWTTLREVLKRRAKSQLMLPGLETPGMESTTSLDRLLEQQIESELMTASKNPDIMYLDFFTGAIDHQGHATNQVAALADTLQHIDALAGRIWTAIRNSPLAAQTVFVVVSDHGMNNRPDRFSQAFSLPDFFGNADGGGHHVVTNRHQLSDYKIMGLDPLVERVITPSLQSTYLSGQSSRYPTAWLDLDGNERAAVQLRNSDLNRIHILLEQLKRQDLPPLVRKAAAEYLDALLERKRLEWLLVMKSLDEELVALQVQIHHRQEELGHTPHKWTGEDRRLGRDRVYLRSRRDLTWWEREHAAYRNFLEHRKALLDFHPDPIHPLTQSIEKLIPEMTLGDANELSDLRHYVAGPASGGLQLDPNGRLDEDRSFRYIDYFPLLLNQTVRNNPQSKLSGRPIDFIAVRLPGGQWPSYLLYGGEEQQLIIETNGEHRLALRGASGRDLHQVPLGPGFPLHLLEDPDLAVPRGTDRAQWLTGWHTEKEWLAATHRCRYSNAVIGITEELSPVSANVPGTAGLNPVLLRYERRRRELVQADFQVFVADGWNLNTRNFNPGGNHGSFFRFSTHSVWMMAGGGLARQSVDPPHDSLEFASTILELMGKPGSMPEHVVSLVYEK